MVTPYFANIRQAILGALEEATEEILVAVYWFTNQELFNALCTKAKEGKRVSLIVHNDYINNREAGLDFQSFIDDGGELYFSTASNPMHNKFCVIDKSILINGSYNWTYYAETKNSENILLVREEAETISAFSKEFAKLKGQFDKVDKIVKITKFELDEFNELSARDYLANDIVCEAKATNRPEIVKSAFELSPNNLKVQEVAVKLDLAKTRKLKCSVGAGLHNDKYLVGVEKGTVLPVSISKIIQTVKDNQASCGSTLYYGNSPFASNNKELGKVEVSRLPLKPAGQAKLKCIFTIDIYGELRVRFYSLDNGRSSYFSIDVNGLISTMDTPI